MRKTILFWMVIFLGGVACTPSYTELTWENKERPDQKIEKLLIIFPEAKDQENRKLLERELAFQLVDKGYQAQASSRFFEEMTRESVVDFLESNGYDGALVIRLKEITHESRFDPATRTSSSPNVEENVFGKSFDERGYNFNTMDRVIVAECKLYQTKDQKILAVAESKTFALRNVEEIAGDFSKAVVKMLHRSKFLAQTN
jgi:hypothetical protein